MNYDLCFHKGMKFFFDGGLKKHGQKSAGKRRSVWRRLRQLPGIRREPKREQPEFT